MRVRSRKLRDESQAVARGPARPACSLSLALGDSVEALQGL